METAPRFLADDMVARLGRWLRVVGFDTVIWPGGPDEAMLAQATDQGRVIVTRDSHLPERAPPGVEVLLLRDDNPVRQLIEVARHCRLDLRSARGTRCQHCNGPLESVDKHAVRDKVPPRSLAAFDQFWRCRECGKVYWCGDHFNSMERTLDWVEAQVAGEESPPDPQR